MSSELTTNGEALRLFFTEDIYLIKGEEGYSAEEVLVSVVQEDSAVYAVAETEPAASVTSGNVAEIPQEKISLPPVSSVSTTAVPSVTAPVSPAAAVPQIPVIPVMDIPVEKPAALFFTFLGKNKKKILILVNDAEHEVSDEPGRELLRKIVKSINLTASDFALLNYAKYPTASYTQLQQYFSSTLIFAFGVSPAALQLEAKPENKIVMEGDVRLIFSGELRKLEQHPAGKKELWGSLQQLGL